jgi:hypothetical protein
LAAKEGIDVE